MAILDVNTLGAVTRTLPAVFLSNLRRANMYAHLFSVWFKKWRHGSHICFWTPMITLFWPISRKLCKIGY